MTILRIFNGLKRLDMLYFFLFVIHLINFVSCSTINLSSEAKIPKPKICKTSSCIKIANEITEKMNRSINPCDNFYEFVCGNFTKNAVIPADRSSFDLFTQLRKKVQKQLKSSIEHGITKNDPRSFKILQSYYKVCMNEDQVEKNSEKEFLDILRNLGGWPVLAGKSWKESSFDWKKAMYKFRETGYSYSYFIDFSVGPDMKKNTQRIIYIDQPSLGLSQEFLSQGLKQDVVKAYFKYMLDLAEIFGANRDEAEKELKESLNFEIELSKISLSSRNRRNMTALYNPMQLDELQSRYPYIPWLTYLNTLLAPHAQLHPSETIVVLVPDFLERLPDLLAGQSRRVLANYAFWRVVKQSVGRLSERVRRAQREFGASLNGNANKKPRWQDCVGHVNDRLHLATGALYVSRYFNKATKNSAENMILDIRRSFRKMLTEVDWMDDTTKEAALEKLDKIIPLVAYPDELLDKKKLDDYHKGLKIHPESFLKTVLSFNLFSTKLEFEKLRRPVAKPDWTGYYGAAAIVNAFYSPLSNTIQFPAGILQGAFFNADYPKYVNFAGIGSIVGHEMTHGFDDSGRRFDKNGNLVDWWDAKTKKEYLKRAECIVNQYSNYTVTEVNLKLDGAHTQGENIADNGGLKEAYYAYDSWQKDRDEEPRLPGLESYSTKQMFWISNANIWCTKYRPELLRNLILTDPHTPSGFRVIGSISNMPEFSRDFNCPAGSFMNPTNRCTIW